VSTLSVDKVLQALFINVYRDSKVCGHVVARVWDNRSKPVD